MDLTPKLETGRRTPFCRILVKKEGIRDLKNEYDVHIYPIRGIFDRENKKISLALLDVTCDIDLCFYKRLNAQILTFMNKMCLKTFVSQS